MFRVEPSPMSSINLLPISKTFCPKGKFHHTFSKTLPSHKLTFQDFLYLSHLRSADVQDHLITAMYSPSGFIIVYHSLVPERHNFRHFVGLFSRLALELSRGDFPFIYCSYHDGFATATLKSVCDRSCPFEGKGLSD